jgi:predicted ATPase/class 3 adenylate cyclase
VRDDLPAGTVTLLFTDVEGSTRLLHELGARAYADALAQHRQVVREACAAEGGVEVDTQGDAFFFAFPTAPGGVAAAQAVTEALAPGPIHLRIGLHTGTPLVADEGYVGDDVNFAARVGASAHGGQIVLSQSTRTLVDGLPITDLGEHRLKDIEEAVPIYQLGERMFPPLRTISNTNLPRPASSFVGREQEREDVVRELQTGTRLLTLTGPGGSGKTRLALEAAAELVPSYKAGVFWIGLASVRDATLVTDTIAQTLGARDGLAEHIGDREMLLLLDNLEQIIEASPSLSELVQACLNLTLLCTSRELLRVNGEVEYAVPPLASPEAVTLFCERSGLEPSDSIAELCAHLDDLPLAIELAAARTTALSTTQILDRLSERLDLLKGGRDADARQRTLRATIAWSYDLLSENEQRVFRALAVFAGGCTLEAAEAVVASDLDTMQSLVEKSLVRFGNERYWMLETIREYARAHLNAAGETNLYGLKHADYYGKQLEARCQLLNGVNAADSTSWYRQEEGNLRATLDRLLELMQVEAVPVALALTPYWIRVGAAAEGCERVRTCLDGTQLDAESRGRLLAAVAELEMWLGNLRESGAAADTAIELARETGDTGMLVDALLTAAWATYLLERVDEGVHLAQEALSVVRPEAGDRTARCLFTLGSFVSRDDPEKARALMLDAKQRFHALGDIAREAACANNLGVLHIYEDGDFEAARRLLGEAVEQQSLLGDRTRRVGALMNYGIALTGLGRRAEARQVLAEVVEELVEAGRTRHHEFSEGLAWLALASAPEQPQCAARILGSVSRLRKEAEFETDPRDDEIEQRFTQPLVDALGQESWLQQLALGLTMSTDETVDLARSLATC